MAYIDKEEFRRQLVNRQVTTNFFKPAERHETGYIIDMLDSEPNADVVEVKHGHWIKAPCSERDGNAHCSECNHWDWSDCHYCPNCGAKMDK